MDVVYSAALCMSVQTKTRLGGLRNFSCFSQFLSVSLSYQSQKTTWPQTKLQFFNWINSRVGEWCITEGKSYAELRLRLRLFYFALQRVGMKV